MSGRVGDWTPADREDELGIEIPEAEDDDEDELGICAHCANYGTDDFVDPENCDIVTMLCTGYTERN